MERGAPLQYLFHDGMLELSHNSVLRIIAFGSVEAYGRRHAIMICASSEELTVLVEQVLWRLKVCRRARGCVV